MTRKRILFLVYVIIIAIICLELVVRIASSISWELGLRKHPAIAQRFEESREHMPKLEWKHVGGFVLNNDASTLPAPVYRDHDGPIRVPLWTTFGAFPPHGFANPPATQKPIPGTVRIACMGGSTTYAGYPGHLQTLMDEHFGHDRIEVVNLGVNASSSPATAVLMERFLPLWKPHIVVVYHGFNDVVLSKRFLQYRGKVISEQPTGDVTLPVKSGSRGILNLLRDWFDNRSATPSMADPVVIDLLTDAYNQMAAVTANQDAALFVSTFASPDYEGLSAEEKDYYEADLTYLWPILEDVAEYEDELFLYNELVRKLTASSPIQLIEIGENLTGGLELFWDNCHQTEAGLKIHAGIVFAALKDTVTTLLKNQEKPESP
jgi:hypothetical protein